MGRSSDTVGMTISAWEKAGQIAIRTRDASMDGYLWYGVLTTGVYCRPSCPSPTAKPEHLRFFRASDDAIQAGFRACKRCHPDQVAGYPEWLEQAVVQLSAGNMPGQVADALGIQPATLSRGLERWLGVGAKDLQQFCLTQDYVAARARGHSVLHAALMAGFASEASMRRGVHRWLGLRPSETDQALTLSWGIAAIELGLLLVALSPKGVAFAAMGDRPGPLLQDLAERFPSACLAPMSPAAGQVLDHFAQGLYRQRLPLPLDLSGTPFQMRVWQALQSVPAGHPIHYAQLAEQIDAPKAARAVGTACASNPICLSVPCHRVIPASGGLGGYRWGQWRKAWLLESESKDT